MNECTANVHDKTIYQSRKSNELLSMVFPQTLNCASAAFEKAASLSKEKLIEFLILFQSYFFISLL